MVLQKRWLLSRDHLLVGSRPFYAFLLFADTKTALRPNRLSAVCVSAVCGCSGVLYTWYQRFAWPPLRGNIFSRNYLFSELSLSEADTPRLLSPALLGCFLYRAEWGCSLFSSLFVFEATWRQPLLFQVLPVHAREAPRLQAPRCTARGCLDKRSGTSR